MNFTSFFRNLKLLLQKPVFLTKYEWRITTPWTPTDYVIDEVAFTHNTFKPEKIYTEKLDNNTKMYFSFKFDGLKHYPKIDTCVKKYRKHYCISMYCRKTSIINK